MGISRILPLIAFFCLLIMLNNSVYAIGISPAKINIAFEPGFERTYQFYVRAGMPGIVTRVESTGPLKDYITPSIQDVRLKPGELRYFTVTIKLPDELEPGLSKNEVVVSEIPPEGDSSGISAFSAVATQVWVRSPYPGKYVDARLSIPNANLTEPVHFHISLSSRGEENVTASAIIIITDESEEVLKTVKTDEVFIISKKTASLDATWDASDTPPGKYYAHATVEYGGEKPAITQTSFKIGDILIKFLNISHPPIQPDDIVKFKLDFDSFWNQLITGAYVELEVFDGEKLIGTSRSETFDIDAWKSKEISLFWDTNGMPEGKYNAKFTVFYEGKTTEKTKEIEIKTPFDPTMYYILIAVGIVVAVILAYFFLKRRKKR